MPRQRADRPSPKGASPAKRAATPRHSSDHDRLGRAMRRLRLDLDITQEELAFRAGLHRVYISEVEIGHRNPSYASLLRIGAGLAVPVSEWIRLAETLPSSAIERQGDARPRSRSRSGRT